MELITIILNCIIIILNSFILFFLLKKEKNNEIQENEDEILNDLMVYAFNKNLNCSVRPGINGKSTLYHTDEKGDFLICEYFSTDDKKGSNSYNKILKELEDKIDNFIEMKNV